MIPQVGCDIVTAMKIAKLLADAAKYVSENKNQLAHTGMQVVRTAHAAASNPDQVVTAVLKTIGKRTGMPIEQAEAEFLGKMMVKKISRRK